MENILELHGTALINITIHIIILIIHYQLIQLLLATALVSSRFHYRNSLLYGITGTEALKLQRIQNRLAHLVTKSPPFTRSVSPLRSLHWLPVRFRILFKINLLTAKPCVKNGLFMFPSYLPHHSHPVHWDQRKVLVCRSLGSRPTQAEELFTLVLRLFGTTSRCLSIQPFQLLPFQETSQDPSLWLVLPSIDTNTPDGPLMLRVSSILLLNTNSAKSCHRVWLRQGY